MKMTLSWLRILLFPLFLHPHNKPTTCNIHDTESYFRHRFEDFRHFRERKITNSALSSAPKGLLQLCITTCSHRFMLIFDFAGNWGPLFITLPLLEQNMDNLERKEKIFLRGLWNIFAYIHIIILMWVNIPGYLRSDVHLIFERGGCRKSVNINRKSHKITKLLTKRGIPKYSNEYKHRKHFVLHSSEWISRMSNKIQSRTIQTEANISVFVAIILAFNFPSH